MNKTFGFIGFGKLGSTLCVALDSNNSIEWIVDSNENSRKKAKGNFKNDKIISSVQDINIIPQYIFITVEDAAIEKTADELAMILKDKLKGVVVLHCSGALPLKILGACEQLGAFTGVIHPYQTFYYPGNNLLQGIGWSVRSQKKGDELVELVKELGGYPFVISDETNITSLYHCSAVVASNFLNTLLSTSEEILQLSGIPSEKFIPQIVKTTIENNFNQNTENKEFTLTGPFVRTDLKTIDNHIKALKSDRHLLKIYCYFALATIEKLRYEKLTDEQILDEMEKMIEFDLKED